MKKKSKIVVFVSVIISFIAAMCAEQIQVFWVSLLTISHDVTVKAFPSPRDYLLFQLFAGSATIWLLVSGRLACTVKWNRLSLRTILISGAIFAVIISPQVERVIAWRYELEQSHLGDEMSHHFHVPPLAVGSFPKTFTACGFGFFLFWALTRFWSKSGGPAEAG